MTLTIDHCASFGHVLVYPDGMLRGIVDTALAVGARSRRVLFLAPLATVARSDLIATVPRRIALLPAAWAEFPPVFG